MAKKKNNTKVEKRDTIENRRDLHKLYLFITVVGYSESDLIVKMLESVGCAYSFIALGQGTSSRRVYDILGMRDEKKGVIFSFIREDKREEAHYVLNEYLMKHPELNKGISFSIKMNSLVGAKIYYFLTNSF